MKMKWGALVVDGRGKIGGHVASRNRSGAYLRTKVTPVNPNTPAQQAVKAILSSLSQAWRGLTQTVRDAWDAAVADFAVTDIFGDSIQPTGKNLYTRLNANITSIGEPTIGTPPSLAPVLPMPVNGVTIAIGAGTYTLDFTAADATMAAQLWATEPVSPGKSFVKNLYRQIGVVDGAAVSPFDFQAAYEAKFGVPPVGEKVFVKLVPVVKTTGQKGVESSGFAIVAA